MIKPEKFHKTQKICRQECQCIMQATLIGGGGSILKYPPPQRKILKIHPLKILGKIFEKQGKNSEI